MLTTASSLTQPVVETHSAISINIWFNGKNTKDQTEHCKPQYEKYVVRNIDRILEESPDVYDPLL
jgi:hypothetical protein